MTTLEHLLYVCAIVICCSTMLMLQQLNTRLLARDANVQWLIQERAELEASLLLHAEALYAARREAIYYRIQYDPGIRGMSAHDIELEVYGPVK